MPKIAKTSSFVRGTVLEEGSHAPVVGAAVRITAISGRKRTTLGTTVTAADGTFRLDVRAASEKAGSPSGSSFELSLERKGQKLAVTGGRSRWFAGQDPGEIRICVTVPKSCEEDACSKAPGQSGSVPIAPGGVNGDVYGRVLHQDGTPVAAVVVRAHDVLISGESAALGSATTDSDGWYWIRIGSLPADPNFVVHVLTASSSGRVIGSSATQWGKAAPVRIDVQVAEDSRRSPSEWATNNTSLEAARGSVAYADIHGFQETYLQGRTGISEERIIWWLAAHRMNNVLNPYPGTDVSEALYGLQYAGLAIEPASLQARGQVRLRDALALARRDNIIGVAASLLFEVLASGLNDWRRANLGDASNKDSLYALFAASAVLTDPQINDLVATYAVSSGTAGAFWAAVADLTTMTSDSVTEAKRLVTLASLAYGHAPTVVAMTAAIGNGPASETASITNWTAVVDAVVTAAALPSEVEGGSPTERRDNYAAQLRANALAAFPSAAIGAGLRGGGSDLLNIRSFATRVGNETFDFAKDDVLDPAWGWAGGSGDITATVIADAAAFQRVSRIAPISDPFGSATLMFNAGIRSSNALSRKGATRGVKALTDLGISESDARLTVAKAHQATGKAVTLFTQAHQNLTGVSLTTAGKGAYSNFLPSETAGTDSIPSWEALFGNVDFCTCRDCRSITGPAAYFVDLLHWLNDREGWDTKLDTRRPDLGTTLLNCNNTNRVMPYIDLALEAMENAVAVPADYPKDTLAETAELLARPQYINDAAYAALGAAIYPITLPYAREVSEARVFMQHMGFSRAELMEAFQDHTPSPTDAAIAKEALGAFPSLWTLVTHDESTDSVSESERWGLTAALPDSLSDVQSFLTVAELTYSELLDLLHTRLINPVSAPATLTLSYGDACDLDSYTLACSTWDATFGALRRAIRLRRLTGWTFRELDGVVHTLGSTVIDDGSATLVAYLHRLSVQTGVGPLELATWFGPVDPWDDRDTADNPVPSEYVRVFLNPAVFPLTDQVTTGSDASKFVLVSGECFGSGEDLHDYAAYVQALASLDADSYDAVHEWRKVALGNVEPKLTRANLSVFPAWAGLAKAAGLSVSDAIDLASLASRTPLSSALSATRFIQEVRELREAGLSADHLLYLLAQDTDARARVAVTPAWIQDVVQRLCDKLAAGPDDPAGTVLDHFASALGVSRDILDALQGEAFTGNTVASGLANWPDFWLRAAFTGVGLSDSLPAADDIDLARWTAWNDDLAFAEILAKVGLLVRTLGLDEETLAFWIGADITWGLLDLHALTLTATDDGLYLPLRRVADLSRAASRLPGTTPTLGALCLTWDSTFLADVASRTSWNVADLEKVAEQILLVGWTERLRGIHRWLDACALVRRTGSSAERVGPWAQAPITPTTASEVVLAARSRYTTPDAWSAVARPIRDRLRKQQRDALVAYLVTRLAPGNITDLDDLYGRLLIDPGMNPEMLTARMKQATCSVQLYIQRNMLGIEGEVVFNEDDRTEWEWMKNYRVWEAARKVFLYPENWIEPELRDDKTPFFKTLENELSQGDITDERAEEATLAYLDRLNEIARPKVLGYFVQREVIDADTEAEETIDKVHVFARSRGQKPSYWYRRWEDQTTWTAWEKIECGVAGEYLVPVVYERRLLLFWFVFDETGADDETASPQKWYSIRLAWSEYRNGKWQPKNEAETPLSLENTWVGLQTSDTGQRASEAGLTRFRFLSSERDGTLVLRGLCWAPDTAKWYEVGSFEMDPCTGEIIVVDVDTQDSETYDFASLAAESLWVSFPDSLRDEIAGTHEDWGSLEPEDREAIENYIFTTPPGDLVYEWGTPIEADDVLGRVEGDFSIPGESERDMLREYLAIYLGTWTDDLQASGDDPSEVKLLDNITGATALFPSQASAYVSQTPFFVAWKDQTWMVVRETSALVDASMDLQTLGSTGVRTLASAIGNGGDNDKDGSGKTAIGESVGAYRFYTFSHPYVCTFIEEVRREGIANLLSPSESGSAKLLSRQQLTGNMDGFEAAFSPTDNVKTPYPYSSIEFDQSSAYAQYNWELFFHVPFYVGNRLMANQRFEDALRWFTFIFDPLSRGTASSEWETAPARYWKVKPFLDPVTAPVTDWLAFTGENGDSNAADSFERQVEEWRDDPFNPHLLARLRPGTYQKTVVMRYIDNLLEWGDNLFTRDTIETINEATQLYMLAGQILGDRPEAITKPTKDAEKTFAELLAEGLDAFSNTTSEVTSPVVWLEGLIGSGRWDPLSTSPVGTFRLNTQQRCETIGGDTYFCIPPNPKLLGYWDFVADRLFKIRNSLNIDGVFRTLPLYEPPIDPALLVRASALGVSLGDVVGVQALPNHRFSTMLPRAQALCGSVKALGGALLAALEKHDAEGLALLRAGHETAMLAMVRTSKEKAIEEAKENLAAQKKTRAATVARRAYYQKLIDKGWVGEEVAASALQATGGMLQSLAGSTKQIGAVLSAIPELIIGTLSGTATGGPSFSSIAINSGDALTIIGSQMAVQAGFLGTVASYKRRAQEWKQQEKQAERELASLDRQIAAAEIRVAIAQHDLKTHTLQAQQSDEARSYMESKFTNQELYDWMVKQVSATYYQSYQLAYKVAQRAQACFQHELPLASTQTFLTAVYWDSTRKGLLAGEQLGYDLERMDSAYLEGDVRELELTKPYSLARFDPVALEALKADGLCYFQIPEVLFDADCPGHYARRIQSVALSIACVPGQQGSVNAQLMLYAHGRRDSIPTGVGTQTADTPADGLPSIVTSIAANDAGLFQPDLRDPKYLPFERVGAISSWRLKLLAQTWKQLDWTQITDVTLHLRYTALDAGDTAHGLVSTQLESALPALSSGFATDTASAIGTGVPVVFSAKRDFPDAWYQATASGATTVEFAITSALLTTLGGTALTSTQVIVVPVGSPTALSTLGSVTAATVTASSATFGTLLTYFLCTGTGELTVTPMSVAFTTGTPDYTPVTLDTLDDVILILLGT